MSKVTNVQSVSFPVGRRQLMGRIFSPSSPRGGSRGALFVHGQRSSQKGYESRARWISTELDAICLTFNLSGHGDDADNYDRYSVYDHLEDVIAAFDYLVRHEDVDRAR